MNVVENRSEEDEYIEVGVCQDPIELVNLGCIVRHFPQNAP